MSSSKPVVVITAGDPAGIGPEVTAKALANRRVKGKAEYVVIGDSAPHVRIGKPSREAGRIAFENIKKAVGLMLSIRGPKALVTAPINKFSMKKAGLRAGGHTEILRGLTNTSDVAMMFSSDRLRLALVTRHIPLSKVPSCLSTDKIVRTTRLFYYALRDNFGIRNPRIAVAGLNPHAGDSGVMGNEEARIITPAVRQLRSLSKGIAGPFPADLMFHEMYRGRLDGAVSMYHDQGLAPFKMLYFHQGVNITLGLPFVRTSPDHGTAFDIAGRGVADPGSMVEALVTALALSCRGKRGREDKTTTVKSMA